MDETSAEELRAETERLRRRVKELEEASGSAFWKQLGDWERTLFGRLLQSSRYGIIVDDRDGRIVSANAGAVSLLGLARSDPDAPAFDPPDWFFADYDGRPLLPEETPFGRVMSSGEAFVGVRNAVHWADGRRKLLSISCAPLFDSGGGVDGVVTIFEDVTKQVVSDEALRESEERFRLMAESISDGISIVEDGRIVYVNDRLEEIMGSGAATRPRAISSSGSSAGTGNGGTYTTGTPRASPSRGGAGATSSPPTGRGGSSPRTRSGEASGGTARSSSRRPISCWRSTRKGSSGTATPG